MKAAVIIATFPDDAAGPQRYVAAVVAHPALQAALSVSVWALRDVYRGWRGKAKLLRHCHRELRARPGCTVYINQDLSMSAWMCVCLRLLGSRRIVVHSHASTFASPRHRAPQALFRWIVRRCATHLIAVSPPAAAAMFGRNACQVAYLPASIDFEMLSEQARVVRARLSADFTMGCIGRLCTQKNQVVLLHALAKLRRRGVTASLALIGHGDDAAMLRALAESLGISDKLLMLEPCVDIGAVYAHQLDAVLVPSHQEGQSRVVAEAQFFGVPVATSAGVPEMAFLDSTQAITGIAGTAEAWADAMASLCKGTVTRRAWQTHAIEHSPLSIHSGVKLLLPILHGRGVT